MSETTTERKQGRIPQRQRRAEARAKLLDATIQCLLEVGYDATTTRRVAAMAGVSPGAQTHYFPRRADLVSAAVEHLAEQRLAEIRAMVADFPAETSQRLRALLDVLWADFSGPNFAIFVKLWVAAAGDPELYGRLAIAEQRITSLAGDSLAQLSGPLADMPGWPARLQLAVSVVRGQALAHHFEPRMGPQREVWPLVRDELITSWEDQARSREAHD